MNKSIAITALLAGSFLLQACGTVSTETTTLPFDVASTSGDVASTASGSTGGNESSAATLAYLNSDLDWVKRDAAQGQGEHIDALASLLGETDKAAFANWAQANYAQIFSTDSADDIYARIVELRS